MSLQAELSSTSTSARRAALEVAVRTYLDGPQFHAEAGSISTQDLLEHIWPEQLAHGENITRRKRLYDDLGVLAKTSLLDYNSPGMAKEIMGRMAVPRRWHRPNVVPSSHLKEKLDQLQRYSLMDGLTNPFQADDAGEWVRFEDVKELYG